MKFEYTWRWYGPKDPIQLSDIKQCGATGIVNALHELAPGEIWSLEHISERKALIEAKGLKWSVVESVPVHEAIKLQTEGFQQYIANYKESVRNLGTLGIKTICYNFMPVLDWTRTDLEYRLPNGVTALRFDPIAFAAFELFILDLDSAKERYSTSSIEQADLFFSKLSKEQKNQLVKTIIAGLPGGHEGFTLDEFRNVLASYDAITPEILRQNLRYFLQEVVPVAEEAGVRLAIHPDDPPYPILGLPRVISTKEDLAFVLDSVNSISNGLTFCSGSLGAREDNTLADIATTFSKRIHFIHFRSVELASDGSFYEADHLAGNANLAQLMHIFITDSQLSENILLPIRPDHGHKMLDDMNKFSNPGYSCIGRLKGLAQLQGIDRGIRYAINHLTV